MGFSVRDGKFDVVVLAGPRIESQERARLWPTPGARAISATCAAMGLRVGMFGGDLGSPRGVIPLQPNGALAVVEDAQGRIHRLRARALVKVSASTSLPDPFQGWWAQGLLPLSTAQRLKAESMVTWHPRTVVLGTGNRAFKFASSLLESGVAEVICLETCAQWGAKRFSGWEVERRRFEMLGGRVVEGTPLKLSHKEPLIWELSISTASGRTEVIETARVVAAGPFAEIPGIREYPPGSNLYELESSALSQVEQDFDGWAMEEERGRWIAARIVRALALELPPQKRDELERIYRRARAKLKRYTRHRSEPFTPAYQGKFIAPPEMKGVRAFRGVPQGAQKQKLIASIECFEEIACNLCEKACPENAIQFPANPSDRILIEESCTACGKCTTACPSRSPVLIHEREDRSISRLTLAWRGSTAWRKGELATLVNRRGESLGSARIAGVSEPVPGAPQSVEVDVPTHLVWEARSLRREVREGEEDPFYLAAVERAKVPRVEITLNGEKRLVREGIPTSIALFEIAQGRPRDVLLCLDGSCGMCGILVDGVKRPACQTSVRKGMAIRIAEPVPRDISGQSADFQSVLCPCLGISREHVVDRIRQGRLRSPDAVLSVTHVGEGKCHGQLCMESFRRVMIEEGVEASQWVDWRFPWTEWVVTSKD